MTEEERKKLKEHLERAALDREIKSFLPQKFTFSYMTVVWASLELSRESYALQESVGKQRLKNMFIFSKGGLKDASAADFRRKIDRQLRMVARKIDTWLEASPEERKALSQAPRCIKCVKFLEADFIHCPWCGTYQQR